MNLFQLLRRQMHAPMFVLAVLPLVETAVAVNATTFSASRGDKPIVGGMALGLAAGLVLARVLANRLFGIAFIDPATWLATLAMVATIALVACWPPARRTAAVDSVVALRNE